MKAKHLFLISLISLLPAFANAQPDSIDTKLLFSDRAAIEKWLSGLHIPALGIGYIKDGKIVQATVFGRNESGQPHPANTIFNVASLTKPVTAMVALKLVSAGKWDIDEPIHKYWTDPDIAGDPRSKLITTRHILSHQTGLPNWRYKNADGKLAFDFTPGEKYQYSGEGFEYLRKALENKFGKRLDQLAAELLFRPLGMKDTRYFWDSTVSETRFAKWHKADGSQYPTYKNTTANAADDLLTTIEDYCKFMQHLMNGAGLSKKIQADMAAVQVRTKPRQHFGLGFSVDEKVKGEESVLTHGGDDKGVHTIAFLFPQSKEGLVIFTNCDNGTDVYIPTVQHYLGSAGQQIIDIETKN